MLKKSLFVLVVLIFLGCGESSECNDCGETDDSESVAADDSDSQLENHDSDSATDSVTDSATDTESESEESACGSRSETECESIDTECMLLTGWVVTTLDPPQYFEVDRDEANYFCEPVKDCEVEERVVSGPPGVCWLFSNSCIPENGEWDGYSINLACPSLEYTSE